MEGKRGGGERAEQLAGADFRDLASDRVPKTMHDLLGFGLVLLAIFADIVLKARRWDRIEDSLDRFRSEFTSKLENVSLSISNGLTGEIGSIRSDIKEFNRRLGHPPTPSVH
jgi:hypothetical protein